MWQGGYRIEGEDWKTHELVTQYWVLFLELGGWLRRLHSKYRLTKLTARQRLSASHLSTSRHIHLPIVL